MVVFMRNTDQKGGRDPEKEREKIYSWTHSSKIEWRLRFRARIVWSTVFKGRDVKEVAEYERTTQRTVRKWRDRFMAEGIDGLQDRPRSGAPCHFEVGQRCEVLAIACDKPGNYGFEGEETWSVSRLTEVINERLDFSMSRSSVWRTLQQNELHPHKMKQWEHSPDPEFKEKVNCIVGLYENPPEDTVILCIDEKTGMQALERIYETQRAIPGRAGRYEYEYIRHGTQALLASFDIRSGKVLAQCGQTRKAEDLERFMEEIVAPAYADASRIIVIWDNLNTHYDGKDERWTKFNERHGGKFEFVYTPKHASWMNQVEIFFSIVHRRVLKHGSFTSVEDLAWKVMAFIERWNAGEGHPFNWTFRGYPMQSEPKVAA